MNISIVIIAYNRSESLKRLLKSIDAADYANKDIDLIISIDKSENDEVFNIAKSFEWIHGNKKIIKHSKNLGLREHILKAGNLVLDYDAIIMLEDDLVVSKSFYKYSEQSVKYYQNDRNVGGISLYSYPVNEFSNERTFIPMQDESDVFFMKVPSSWGQIWTKEQWESFKDWYNDIGSLSKFDKNIIPHVARNWGDSSWKKYFYLYLALYSKYIVYPRIGLSTNMADIGTHHKVKSTAHQSILMGDFERDYVFKEINNSLCKYDAFFENEAIPSFISQEKNILVDFYNIKEFSQKDHFIITTEKLNYKVLNEWGLYLKPYELNIFYDIVGKDIFLYDLNKEETNNNHHDSVKLIKYESPSITRDKALKIAIYDYIEAIKRKINRVFRFF